MTTFEEWAESSGYHPTCFRARIEAGEEGNRSNPWLAAAIAYRAGVEEGKRQAAEKISKFLKDA